MGFRSLSITLLIGCLVPLLWCYPLESDLDSSSGTGEHQAANPKVTIANKPKITGDHSRGVYMHEHTNFPNLPGAPGKPFHAQYMHEEGGIGRKRSLRETMMKMLKIRTRD